MLQQLEVLDDDMGKCKIVYRHYATLYFVFVVDRQESDLGILDLIQVFVEVLDKCFENVCELDIIFHSDKVFLLTYDNLLRYDFMRAFYSFLADQLNR